MRTVILELDVFAGVAGVGLHKEPRQAYRLPNRRFADKRVVHAKTNKKQSGDVWAGTAVLAKVRGQPGRSGFEQGW